MEWNSINTCHRVPQRFLKPRIYKYFIYRSLLKPAVCKYLTTVNNSINYIINILLPKPYSSMWHLVRGNCVRNCRDWSVRNGSDRRARNPPNAFTKSCTFENSFGVCSTTQALWNQWWHGWWAQRSPLSMFVLSQWIRACPRDHSAAPIGIFKSASFGERVSPVSGFLSPPFLTRFPHMKCHIQGQGFCNKMYILELFTVVGYLHTDSFKNRRGIFFCQVKCGIRCAPIH